MSKKNQLLTALIVLLLVVLACGDTTPEAPAPTEPPAAEAQPTEAPAVDEPTDASEPTETPEPTDIPEPTDTPAPTDTPVPTDTPEPTVPSYQDPVTLEEIEGIGETVTDNYEWPACRKAVFHWVAQANSHGSASLIIHLHKVGADREVYLVNEFGSDVDEITGSVYQPLLGGEYYLSSENTDEPWSVRLECQDGVAPVGQEINLQLAGNLVTDNYELPACSKSVFVWSVEPSEHGRASLILRLCRVGEERCDSVVNEFASDLTEPFTGESLESTDGGLYFLVTDNTSGQSWSVIWECRD